MKSISWVLLLPVVLFSSTAEEVALKAEEKLLSLESLKAQEQVLF